MTDKIEWIPTGLTSVAVGECIRLVMCPPRTIFSTEGGLYCVEDTCTHEDFSLSEGFLEGDVIECAYHFAKFSVVTGAVVTQPASRGLTVYGIKQEANEILVSKEPIQEARVGAAR